MLIEKAHEGDIFGRIREIQADPSNARIARVSNAGEIVDGHLITHNGLRIKPTDPGYVKLLQANQGCHEPQEEFVFQELLPHIPPGGSILELGAYWAFYSMWFAKQVSDAQCYLVEPRSKNLKLGQYNFANNGVEGRFVQAMVGNGHFSVDGFMTTQKLRYLDVLHADIQGAEYAMLHGAEDALKRGRIGYVFVGTHSQELHYQCKSFLEQHGYITVAHADYDHGTFCCDGVLVARHRDLKGLDPLQLPLRDATQQREAESRMSHLKTVRPAPIVKRRLRRLWQRMTRKVMGDRRVA